MAGRFEVIETLGGVLVSQAIDALVLVVFCSLACIVFFNILKRTVGMRSDEAAEVAGLDLPEMGALAYPDFLEAQGGVFASVPGHTHQPATAGSLRQELGS